MLVKEQIEVISNLTRKLMRKIKNVEDEQRACEISREIVVLKTVRQQLMSKIGQTDEEQNIQIRRI